MNFFDKFLAFMAARSVANAVTREEQHIEEVQREQNMEFDDVMPNGGKSFGSIDYLLRKYDELDARISSTNEFMDKRFKYYDKATLWRDDELSEIRDRLDKLEKTIKEIRDEIQELRGGNK